MSKRIDAMWHPDFIPGLFNLCDQWCDYCPLTARCLAYSCISERRVRAPGDIYHAVASRLHAAVQAAREAAAADGAETGDLDALLSLIAPASLKVPTLAEPLARIDRMGRQYFLAAARYLSSRLDAPELSRRRQSGQPTALDVLAWYHRLIPTKVFRALVGTAQAAEGEPDRAEDATISARIALISIDKSILALAELAAHDDDARIDHLRMLLRQLARVVEAAFPHARSFVRPYFDEPATPRPSS
jgi:hypothetical protein